MSDEQILHKNNGNGKATIDRNFFKSMAKMIKANRPSIADAGVRRWHARTTLGATLLLHHTVEKLAM